MIGKLSLMRFNNLSTRPLLVQQTKTNINAYTYDVSTDGENKTFFHIFHKHAWVPDDTSCACLNYSLF